MNKYLCEFVGTYFLVLVVALTGNPLAIGAILAAMVYAGGYISGAHYNPAVTLSLFLVKKISKGDAMRYIAIQMIAGLAAAYTFSSIKSDFFLPSPGIGVTPMIALFVETICTFALCFTVLRVAASTKVKGNQYFGLAIGLTLMAVVFAGGPISGGAFNPAVGVSPLLLDASNIGMHLTNIAIYTLGPLLGGALAALAFSTT